MAAINVQRSPSPPPLEESNNGFLSQSLASTSPPSSQTLEQYPSSMEHDYESICWGCGLRLILPSNAPVFKCGWCGAITKQNESRREGKKLRWRRLRDRCFVSILLVFVSFVISITDAGTPSPVVWGSYPAVRKDELQDYTFCQYCSKPKSPRAHHCSSCGSCVLDMDHHCPFIGNCVGAGNHRYFIGFLIVAVISVTYAAIMSAYAILHVLPSVGEGSFQEMHGLNSNIAFMGILKDIFIAFVTSAVFFSPRGLVLLYLFVASISVGIGLTVLLWQQLYFIYEGRTYLTSLSSQDDAERDCRNLYRFFGFPHSFSLYFRVCCNSKKIHRKL
ncbi:protein S-acyltransferase 11-like isoform X2 [Chenopodium quinoa]|uniref:protein S-acyltransferase 11-like isoform X2 n=1 Tax=Chenopodium quinoa TaxID=63459 RepID=UPI000B78381B|nr:protein S-acyltransferase 11-like isoform X2 [Chenopodium quinoa]